MVLTRKEWIQREFNSIDLNKGDEINNLALFQSQLSAILSDLTRLQWEQFQKDQTDVELNSLEQQIKDKLFETEFKLTKLQYQPVKIIENDVVEKEEIDINVLRNRLLSSKTTQFDSMELENKYHDNLQSELIDSLPAMVTAIREQASQFQEMIQNDANILKDVTNKFEMSHGKFNVVNEALSKYHKEGKLGIWFYIRLIVSIFLVFLTLLVLIRLIPAR